MISSTAPQPKLNLEIKVPKEDEYHFMQINASSTGYVLKHKIFKKASSLEGEKPDNYVLTLRQESKVNILQEDRPLGNHPWIGEDTKDKLFTIYVVPKNEKQYHSEIKRKNSITRLSMQDDNRFPIPNFRTASPTKQLLQINGNEKGRAAEEEDCKNSIEHPSKIARSKSEPVLRRSVSTISELTSEFDLLSSSDIDSMDSEPEDDYDGVHAPQRVDTTQTSPKVQLRVPAPIKKIGSAPIVGKDVTTNNNDKQNTKSKKSLWPLWSRRDEEKEAKQRKHTSLVITRNDSGGFQVANIFTPVNKNRSASFEADSPPTILLPKTNSSGALPVPADYSLKRTNTMLIVEEDSNKLVLTAGTVEQLIWCLADRDIPDPAYLDEFFYSMSYFTTGAGLVTHLRTRYAYTAPEGATSEMMADYDKWRPIIQQRVLNVLRYVMDNHWYHFERDEEFLPLVRDFVESSAVRSNHRAKTLREAIAVRIETVGRDTLRRAARVNSAPPPPDQGSPISPQSSLSPSPNPSPLSAALLSRNVDSMSPPSSQGGGSTDLGTHGRSPSSPTIVWRARRDTISDAVSSPALLSSPSIHDDAPSTPTSLTTIASTVNFPPPKPLGKRFKDHKKVSFTRVHPLEMARQLTLIEKELFRAIRPPELVGGAFKKKNKAEISSNVVHMVDWFNHITAWVQKELVLTPNLKERISMLAQFIQVATHLREFGNLSGAMQIVSALDTASVKRLHKTWKGLPRKDMALFESLKDSFSSVSNFANYRRLSHETTGPILPYIGVVLQDLLMIEELPTTLTNGMVNFRKMRRFASLLRSEILERQTALPRFNFEPVPAIQEYLAKRMPASEQDMYRYSRLSEPSKMV